MRRLQMSIILLAVLVTGCGGGGGVTSGDTRPAADDTLLEVAAELPLLPDASPLPDAPDLFELAETEDTGAPGELPWGPEEGEAGWPCVAPEDCNSGYCILTPDGTQCTSTCEQECPFDWECVPYTPALPDPVFICAPTFMDLCRPCQKNADCTTNDVDLGQLCVQYGPAGSFCGGPCEQTDDCPGGFACESVTDVTGANAKQCMLSGGTCTCAQSFVDEDATTTCYAQNEWGTCYGERSCLALGLSECSAALPAAEECNGLDDDCDDEVDEGTSGGECLVANQFGACPGLLECLNGKLSCLGAEPKMELCDGADNDCDGKVDEDFSDTDGDGIADCLENDKDGDGIADGLDNCPSHFNPDQKDFDLDTIGNVCDPDDDNDLSPDDLDCLPQDPAAYPGAQETCDGKDNDCNALVDEGWPDTDGDGWKNCVDTDDDNDGTEDGQDCKPLDPLAFPGADELCDGKDNNCDFGADEGFPDGDGDGIADCVDPDKDGDGVSNVADNCPLKSNPGQDDLDGDSVGDLCDTDQDGDAIPNATDNCPTLKNTLQVDTDEDGDGDACDADMDGDGALNDADNCPLVANPAQTDTDGDGTGDACETDADGDGVPDTQDCAPLNSAIHPGAVEVCDGVDNDCDLAEDESFPDSDFDGLKDCVDADDDNDGDPDETDCKPLDPAFSATATEVCDGLDNDCDLELDEGLGSLTCGKGACAHKVAACADGKVQVCDPYEGASPETCDGLDNDCDGILDEDLGATTCGLGVCAHSVPNCAAGQPQECDPMEGASQEVCDGVDNDCDGKTDEELGSLACGKGNCFHTVAACVGGVVQECNPFEGAKPEVCDGVDNDCDGVEDEGLGSVLCGVGGCLHEMDYCVDGKVAVCNPFQGAAPEVCDGQDNDCDGLVDEDLFPVTCGKGICQHTVAACVDGVPQECDALEGALPEQCDGFDNDCDGLTDEGLGFTTCGQGQCLHTVSNCVDGMEVECDPLEGASAELCDGDDNDCDGETDPEDSIGCTLYFRDEDEDGFGVSDDSACLCTMATPYTAIQDGDCDDGSADLNPGQTDDCLTSLDEDCSGQPNEACTYAHCSEILQYNPAAQSGPYTIDPDGDGGSDPFDVYCDMATDGGGWTLVMKQASDMGYGSPLSVSVWSGWSQANVTLNPEDATLEDANMVNLAYSLVAAEKLRLTASSTWTDVASGAWSRTVNTTAYDALSNAKANQTGNEGGTDTTPWAPASFTDHTWTSESNGSGLCWRAGPFFNVTSYQYTQGGIKWGWFFNNECHESTTDTGEGLGCCGNSGWYRKSAWALYLWVR